MYELGDHVRMNESGAARYPELKESLGVIMQIREDDFMEMYELQIDFLVGNHFGRRRVIWIPPSLVDLITNKHEPKKTAKP